MTALNVNTDIICHSSTYKANAGNGLASQFHLLDYPNDSLQPDALTRLVFTCDTDQDLSFVTAFCERYAQHFNCSIVEPFRAADVDRVDYVRWLANQQQMGKNTVLIALVGPTSSTCANVDWDIAAALTNTGAGTAGLAGIILPHYFDMASEVRNLRIIPHRLSDNTICGYATLYTWEHLMKSLFNVQGMVQKALQTSRVTQVTPVNKRSLRKA